MSWKNFKARVYKVYDQKMTVWEQKGFRAANKAHKYALNGLFIFIAYNIYDILRSYNDLFLHLRATNKYEEADMEGPINKEWSLSILLIALISMH